MDLIIINDKEYFNSDYVFEKAPIYSKGLRTSRTMISKKQIDAKYYIYARKYEDKWIVTDGKSVKFDKVFFIKSFIDKIPELKDSSLIICDENGIMKAPEIILLEDHEKFTDKDGKIINIETRGERVVDKIYFKVKDISNGFQLNDLQDIIIDNRNNYQINEHYIFFNCIIPVLNGKKTSKQNNAKKELFLTYEGLLRLLFVSKNDKTKKFIKWATEKLFTIQMGTLEQKQKLRDSLGVIPNAVKEVCKKSTSPLSCVYLFSLGTVSQLKETFNIPNNFNDNDIVVKYGRTDDLERRTNEHNNDYGKMKNVDLRLMMYSFIDVSYISMAENDLGDYFDYKFKFEFENRTELAIIPKDKIDNVKKEYEKIRGVYGGKMSEIINKIEMIKLQNTVEIQKLQHEIELQKEKYNHEILKRDFEIYKLKQSK
jgi:hypothetical protein